MVVFCVYELFSGGLTAFISLFFFYSVVVSGSISSIGLGGGAVPIVQPIHAPIPRTATKAISTGIATSQN